MLLKAHLPEDDVDATVFMTTTEVCSKCGGLRLPASRTGLCRSCSARQIGERGKGSAEVERERSEQAQRRVWFAAALVRGMGMKEVMAAARAGWLEEVGRALTP